MTRKISSNLGISFHDLGSQLPKSVSRIRSSSRNVFNSPEEELATILYSFLSDVPEDVMTAVVDAVMILLLDKELSDRERLLKIEDISGTSLPDTTSNKINSVAQKKLAMDLDQDDMLSDNSDLVGDTDDSDDNDDRERSDAMYVPKFIALNDSVRSQASNKISPKDIDTQWLESKLESTPISVERFLQLYERLRDLDSHSRQLELEQLFGPKNLALAQSLCQNSDLVVLYTRLSSALSPEEGDTIEQEINRLGLGNEISNDDVMSDDSPKLIDVDVGKPLSEPVDVEVNLPPNSTRLITSLYEQFNVPADPPKAELGWPIIKINELPEYVQPFFSDMSQLNAIQSRVANAALHSDINILVCAPTGAGKTNIAMSGIAKCLQGHMRAVYISPQKALVQEQVATLTHRLPTYKVAELSGDSSLSRLQLSEIDVIVSTPEKWDIVSRKSSNAESLRSIDLVIVDEVHLLHDEERGGVIENIVIRHKDLGSRLIGLSATLPNFVDVAAFMSVPITGLFHFDGSFRPVPLKQQYVGVLATSPVKKRDAINEACIEKVSEVVVNQNKQVLVFVHSRRDTTTTRDLLLGHGGLKLSHEQIGTHHAGLSRAERSASETAFKDGTLRVLVCTMTLAWGVNLPAAAVIIKGTDFYRPGRKGWQQLGPQDVLQMLGRAGRPGFDSEGLGIIITSRDHSNYVASIARLSIPIESHSMYRVYDSINAEVVSNNIRNLEEACAWLEKSFWAVRWKADPALYGDNYKLIDMAHTISTKSSKQGAIAYQYPEVEPTVLGKSAANFYITPDTMETYVRLIRPWYDEPDLLNVFASSGEFSSLSVRPGEKGEIERLRDLVPIPIKGESNSLYAKVGVSVQAYISRLSSTGLALQNDTVYIAQSATRLLRAIFELAVNLKWGKVARITHRMYTMVDHQLWASGQSSFRQFSDCPELLAKKSESSRSQWSQLFHLDPKDLAAILKISDPKVLEFAESCLASFPKFQLKGEVKPITSDWLLVNLFIIPDFQTENRPEEIYETFYLLVEDQSEEILYSKRLTLAEILSKKSATHNLHISVSKGSIWSPYLYVRLSSDRWLNSESSAHLKLRNSSIPKESVVLYELELAKKDEAMSDSTSTEAYVTSPVSRALRPLLCDVERSAFIGLPPGLDQQNAAQIAISEAESLGHNVLVSAPDRYDLDAFQIDGSKTHLIDVFTAEIASRSPAKLKVEFSKFDCIVCLNLHSSSDSYGHIYEIVITRLSRFWKSQNLVIRFSGLGYQINSAESVGLWLGASKKDIVNFENNVREPRIPTITVQKYDGFIVSALKCTLVMPLLKNHECLLIVASSQSQVQKVEHELLLMSEQNEVPVKSITIRQFDDPQLKITKPGDYENVILFELDTNGIPAHASVALAVLSAKQTVIFSSESDFTTMSLKNPSPTESQLGQYIGDASITEIANNDVYDAQTAIAYLSSTFLYRRLQRNPGFYGCSNKQDWISELLQSTFEKLAAFEIVEIVDEDSLAVKPCELCYIMAHAGADIEDSQSFKQEHKSSTYLHNVDSSHKIEARITLCVASNYPLSSLFELVEKRQSYARSLPLLSSSSLQIPWVDSSTVLKCNDAGVHTIMDFIAIEDDDFRSALLGFGNEDERMIDVANFINGFPIVDIVNIDVSNNTDGIIVTVDIEYDVDEDISANAEETQLNTWYSVIGNTEADRILAFKQITIKDASTRITLKSPDDLGNAKVWLMSGEFMDADKEHQISIRMIT